MRKLLQGQAGKPSHPPLTDASIGAYTVGVVMLVAGAFGLEEEQMAHGSLIALSFGLLLAAPTALTGIADWVRLPKQTPVRRVATIHLVAMVAATVAFAASWVAQLDGYRDDQVETLAVVLGAAAMGLLTAGGFLGGDLAYARGVGVNETLFDRDPEDWTAVLDASMLVDDRPMRALAGERELLIVKRDGTIHALADRCAHRGGMLHEGELEGDCIVCPLHGTRFRLEDGSVLRGPSTYAQPVYEARVNDGRVEVRAARAAGS